MIPALRTILTMMVVFVITLLFGSIILLAAALKVPDRPGSVYDVLPRIWSRLILWAAGARVIVHGSENIPKDSAFICTANHLSLLDIPAVLSALPRHYFIAKSELFKIPVFGAGIAAIGTIRIERNNQKAAFGSYQVAAERIKKGSSVVVFPEGTRGYSYAIRPFKKGPFVLGIQAGVPILPCIIHGTMEILPKKSLRLRSTGVINVHLLSPVSTAGLDYEDRGQLAIKVQEQMSDAMSDLYNRT